MDNNRQKRKSCVTDTPIQKKTDDSLQAEQYINALQTFIVDAETPVTIGIQGSWGSGKTSLISVLREQLDENAEHSTLSVFVNAWEHSLFHPTDSKAEVALSLLSSLADGIKNEASNKTWINQQIKDAIKQKSTLVDKAVAGIGWALRFGLKAAVSYATGGTGLANGSAALAAAVSGAMDGTGPGAAGDKANKTPNQETVAKHVQNLRRNLQELVATVTQAGKPAKVVFFLDDLDRVPPPTAVEILDLTKNIFDIPNCVFVLTIDYEVIVKGLEKKFGPKNEENEREFRQYFDKIIQIPFIMPVGVYANHIQNLLKPALESLQHYDLQEDSELLKKLADAAQLATGGIPRGIKRIVNTLSLLRHIHDAKPKEKKPPVADEQKADAPDKLAARRQELEVSFIVIALHINFPEICRRLMEDSNFTQWKLDQKNQLWNLKQHEAQKDLAALAQSEYFNDEWEKVVYCLCTKNAWLKAQAGSISQLLNKLLTALGGKPTEAIPEEGLDIIGSIMDNIRVVSMDSAEQAQPVDESSVKTDSVTQFCKDLHAALHEENSSIFYDKNTKEYAKRMPGERVYMSSISKDEEDEIKYFRVVWEKDDEYLSISFGIDKTRKISKRTVNSSLNKKKDYFVEESNGIIYTKKYYSEIDRTFFKEKLDNNYVEDAHKLYQETKKVCQGLSG